MSNDKKAVKLAKTVVLTGTAKENIMVNGKLIPAKSKVKEKLTIAEARVITPYMYNVAIKE